MTEEGTSQAGIGQLRAVATATTNFIQNAMEVFIPVSALSRSEAKQLHTHSIHITIKNRLT